MPDAVTMTPRRTWQTTLRELRIIHGCHGARAVDATRPQPGAPPLLTVADIARGMGLSDFYLRGWLAWPPR